jgi:hypothetical protein
MVPPTPFLLPFFYIILPPPRSSSQHIHHFTYLKTNYKGTFKRHKMMKEERQHLMGGEPHQHHKKDKSLAKSWQTELYEAWRQFAVLTRKNFIMMVNYKYPPFVFNPPSVF